MGGGLESAPARRSRRRGLGRRSRPGAVGRAHRRVVTSLTTQASTLSARRRDGIDACIRSLTNNAEHLRYDQALEAGWPIATGVIEGACRHLIADRFDLAGARWGLAGAEAVLKLRAVTANGHLDAYWRYHLARQHERVHQTRYQDGYALTA